MSFSDLGLDAPILKAVLDKGYTEATPVQAQAIPAILKGQDVMAAAQTGTGKTAGFVLPILQKLSRNVRVQPNQARSLILTPTRELAIQVAENVTAYSENLPLKSAVVFGGVKINPQMQKLRRGVDVLVATPGRLLDLYSQNAVKFKDLEVLVLDEADRMLDMGFIHDIKRVLALLPQHRQNLLFSATFSQDIRNLAKGLVNDPVEISVTPRNATAPLVEQLVYSVDKSQKNKLLVRLIKEGKWKQVLVFSRTKYGANRLATFLEKNGIKALPIHGNKSQGARTKALANFKDGSVRVLVATDIAARGIDIDQLPNVVNFDLPNVSEDYVHRIGRTGRAGASGLAVSLVAADEFDLLVDIQRLTQKIIERKVHEDFVPVHELPDSSDLRAPKRPKKPKAKKPSSNFEQGQDLRSKRSGPKRRSYSKPQPNNGQRSEQSSDRSDNRSSENKPKKRTWKPRPKRTFDSRRTH